MIRQQNVRFLKRLRFPERSRFPERLPRYATLLIFTTNTAPNSPITAAATYRET